MDSATVTPSTNPSPFDIPSATEQNRERIQKRIQAVATIIQENGGTAPTYREIQRRLKAHGASVSLGTIANIMACLGKSDSPSLYIYTSLGSGTVAVK